jgi:hypothetical protein
MRVDHQRGQRLAFDVLGDDQQRLAGLGRASSTGSRSRMLEIFLSCSRTSGIFEPAPPACPDR